MLYVFALCGLIVFMVYWAITHSGPFQTSKIELYLQEVNLLAQTFERILNAPLLNVKSTSWPGFCIFCSIFQVPNNVYFTISVRLDSHSKRTASQVFSDRSLRPRKAATKRFSWKQNFLKFQETQSKTTNLSKIIAKYLQRSIYLVKLQTLNLQFCRRNELQCKYLLFGFCTFQEHLLQNRPQRNLEIQKFKTIQKFNVCYVVQGILLFIFSRYSSLICLTDRW